MVNYYRALTFGLAARIQALEKHPYVTVPTLILWGKNDTALQESLAQASRKLCTHPESSLVMLEASHWVQLEAPEIVNQEILKFIQEIPSAYS
jgi:pimeloyl-ACP methyl ester carboxylesterase